MDCPKKNYAPIAGTGAVIFDIASRLNIMVLIWYDFIVLDAVRDELLKLLNNRKRADNLSI